MGKRKNKILTEDDLLNMPWDSMVVVEWRPGMMSTRLTAEFVSDVVRHMHFDNSELRRVYKELTRAWAHKPTKREMEGNPWDEK